MQGQSDKRPPEIIMSPHTIIVSQPMSPQENNQYL
jgi:hypothetical protein